MDLKRLILPFSALGFTAGAAVFYALPSTPSLAPVLGVILVAGLAVIWVQKITQNFAIMFIAIGVLCGFAWADFRLPTLPKKIDGPLASISKADAAPPSVISGRLVQLQFSKRGYRAQIDMEPGNRLHLVDRAGQLSGKLLGCTLSVTARFLEPSSPAYPDAYDPRARSFFEQESQQAVIIRSQPISVQSCSDEWPWRLMRWRFKAIAQVAQALPPQSKGVMMALIFGTRHLVPLNRIENYRASGLAHLLAISGLHMALFAGSVYFLCRLLCVMLFTEVRLRDARLPALVIAILAGAAYLFISGAGFATQRAFVMLCAALCAAAFHRPVLSLHNVGSAALVVMVSNPAAIRSPGFLMSFSAVICLISLAAALGRAPLDRHKIRRFFVLLFLTSLVAGTVTGLIGLYYFHQAARYGLLANLLAVPIFSFVVMPSLAIGTVTIGTPISGPMLSLANIGLQLIDHIAATISGLPGAVFHLPRQSPIFLVLICLGVIASPLGRVGLKLNAVLIGLLVLVVIYAPQRGDIYIFGRGRHMAMRDPQGQLWLMDKASSSYIVDQWRRAEGQEKLPVWACPKGYCAMTSASGLRVQIAFTDTSLRIACRQADLVLTPLKQGDWPVKGCRDHLISMADFKRNDVHIVTLTPFVSCQSMMRWGRRPWPRWVYAKQFEENASNLKDTGAVLPRQNANICE